jgi:transcriptional regulator with XRE-family HTH domain
MEDASLLVHNLRLRMKAKGVGPKALSLQAGLNETYVRDLLKGRSLNPRQGHLQNLAAALDCRVSDLTGEMATTRSGDEATQEAKRALLDAFDAMSEEQRRALLIVAKGMVPEARPAEPVAESLPRRRSAACLVPEGRMRGR